MTKIFLKIANLFVKKPLGKINGVINTPGWKGKTGAIIAILTALAGLIGQIDSLTPLDLNDLSMIAKSEYIYAIGLALSAFGIRKRQDQKEEVIAK